MRREEVAGTLEKGAGMERGCADSVGREGRAVNVCLEGYREMWKGGAVRMCVCSFCPVWDSQLVCFVPHTLQYVQVLKVLLRSYQELETPDYISVCQVYACQIHKHTSFPPSPPSFPPSLPLSLSPFLPPPSFPSSLPLYLLPSLPFLPASLLPCLPSSLPPSFLSSLPHSSPSLSLFFPPVLYLPGQPCWNSPSTREIGKRDKGTNRMLGELTLVRVAATAFKVGLRTWTFRSAVQCFNHEATNHRLVLPDDVEWETL